jgi:nucleotide-binding universal stress UspA family protein
MKVLAAVDRSAFSDKVIEMTQRIGGAKGMQVLLINVAPREPDVFGQQLKRKVISEPVPKELLDRKQLLERLAGILRSNAIRCETMLIRGDPAPTILREAGRWGADLLVMGSHGHGMLYRKVMGSVSDGVLRARQYPVLIVPDSSGSDKS